MGYGRGWSKNRDCHSSAVVVARLRLEGEAEWCSGPVVQQIDLTRLDCSIGEIFFDVDASMIARLLQSSEREGADRGQDAGASVPWRISLGLKHRL
jgi:hypothetical protein